MVGFDLDMTLIDPRAGVAATLAALAAAPSKTAAFLLFVLVLLAVTLSIWTLLR